LELALVLVPFVWLMLGTIDIARYIFTLQQVVGLLSEAGRMSLTSIDWAPFGTNSWAGISTVAPLLDPTQVTLDVTQGLSGVGVYYSSVTVQYPFVAYTPGLAMLSGTITETTNYAY
jgi:Flp pilus assembly protein TadG